MLMPKSFLTAFVLAFAMTSASVFAASNVPEVCVVNGDKFSERTNPPLQVSHEGKTITVCCRKCARKFEKDPAKYIKLYEEALAKEAAAKKAQAAK